MLCPFCSEEINDEAKKCRFCHEWVDQEPGNERSPATNQGQDAREIKMIERARESIEKSLKWRYTWLGIVAVFLTGGGAELIIHSALRNSLKETEKNTARAEVLVEKLTADVAEISEALIEVKKLRAAASDVTQKVNETEARAANLTRQLETTIGNSSQIASDVEELTLAISALVQEVQPGQFSRTKLSELETSTKASSDAIKSSLLAAQRSVFDVYVPVGDHFADVKSRLTNRGYTVVGGLRGISPTLIIIGEEVPADVFREVSGIVRSAWPGIRRIAVETGVPSRAIFLVKDAFGQGHTTELLSHEDWRVLLSPDLSSDELHLKILSLRDP